MADGPNPTIADYSRMAAQMEENLRAHVLAPWYPAAMDSTRGGFTQDYDESWKPSGSSTRSIVYQSRLTWVASEMCRRYPSRAAEYRRFALHGLKSLDSTLWDRNQGGFYWDVDTANGHSPGRNGEKHAYGNSFGIYAAAACFLATKDEAALNLAKRGFDWLDKHAHDAKNGGYFEALTRDGKPILQPPTPYATDFIGTHYGFKSMNTHIHLLEAFTTLHEAWPHARVKKRLEEVFRVVLDKIAVFPGCLNLFFTPEWRPVPDHDSFGHDVETAYLLVEAAKELGKEDDAETWKMARMIVDHALDFGWDRENGGFYEAGSAFGRPTDTSKVWWTQAEGLNALLLLHEKYGRETLRYWDAFQKQWEFINHHQVDSKNHGWYPAVEQDGKPRPGMQKSNAWTDPYHQGRALMTCIAVLKCLAARP